MPAFRRVIPLLVCEDIEAEYQFLVEVFQFAPGFIHRDAEGRALHGEVRAGGTDVWLHRVSAEHQVDSPRGKNTASAGLVVHVDDVDAHFNHACIHGAHVDGPPEDRPYGQRDYGVRDIEGHRWWFASPI